MCECLFFGRTVPFRYANVFNSSLLNITLACFSFSLHVLFVRVLSNPPLSFCMPGWFFISHDQISFMCYDELCLSTQLIQDDSIIYKWTRERKTDNNLQDESRIFVLSSKCPYTHTYIAHGHIEFTHIAMDIFGLYSMKMLFFSVESPVCELVFEFVCINHFPSR